MVAVGKEREVVEVGEGRVGRMGGWEDGREGGGGDGKKIAGREEDGAVI